MRNRNARVMSIHRLHLVITKTMVTGVQLYIHGLNTASPVRLPTFTGTSFTSASDVNLQSVSGRNEDSGDGYTTLLSWTQHRLHLASRFPVLRRVGCSHVGRLRTTQFVVSEYQTVRVEIRGVRSRGIILRCVKSKGE